MDESLAFASIGKLGNMLRRRDISPVELTEFFFERIEQFNPTVNAYIALSHERARAQAQAAESLMARGHFLGPLHGIPLALKDLIDVEGMSTTGGSILRRDHVAEADAHVTGRLFREGAVLLGDAVPATSPHPSLRETVCAVTRFCGHGRAAAPTCSLKYWR